MFPFILKKKIRKKAHAFERRKNFFEYSEVKRVLLLFDVVHLPEIQVFANQLKQEGKEVVAYTFEEKKRKEPLNMPAGFHLLTGQDTDFFGVPRKSLLQAFTGIQADTIMDLSLQGDLVLRYLYLHSKAEFRVGFNTEFPEWYDLTIETRPDQEYSFLLSQLHFYLKSLRTK
jgi:hypothetical protein